MSPEQLAELRTLHATLSRLLAAEPAPAVPTVPAAPLAELPPFLSIADFARHLRVGLTTVRRWVRDGLPSTRYERVVRIKTTEALRWLEQRGERGQSMGLAGDLR